MGGNRPPVVARWRRPRPDGCSGRRRRRTGHVVPAQVGNHHRKAGFSPQEFTPVSGRPSWCGRGWRRRRWGCPLSLWLIAAPGIVFLQVVAQVFVQNGGHEGADFGDVKAGCLLRRAWTWAPYLPNDVDVIPAGFLQPGFVGVQGAELAEPVGGEEEFSVCSKATITSGQWTIGAT